MPVRLASARSPWIEREGRELVKLTNPDATGVMQID